MTKLILCLAVLAVVGSTFAADKIVMCYYGSWAHYRLGNGGCKVEDLDPFLCTHYVYTFVGINDNDASINIMDPWLELPDNWGKDNFGQFNRMKEVNPKLKTIIAIGGWNELSAKYSKVANDPQLRSTFARNAAEFTMKHGFDGFDLDWEYPGQRDSPNKETDIQAHALLLGEMRAEFDKHGLLLTAAVASVRESAEKSYDIPVLGRHLDLINVMAYDLHGAWDSRTGHNAALYAYESDVPAEDSYDVQHSIDFWLAAGAPKEKLVLGLPLYARTFNLQDAGNNGVLAPTNGAGMGGPYTNQQGFLGFNEFCEKKLLQNWPEHWDDSAKVPYSSLGNDWITYETLDSLALKVEFALSRDLAGVMVWSVETDDFRGVCGGERYPYLKHINKVIDREIIIPSSTTSHPDASTTTSTSTERPGGGSTVDPDQICQKEGYVRDPYDCSVYHNCVLIGPNEFLVYTFTCYPLFFDDVNLICNFPEAVDCRN